MIGVGDSAPITKSKHALHPTLLLVKPPLTPPCFALGPHGTVLAVPLASCACSPSRNPAATRVIILVLGTQWQKPCSVSLYVVFSPPRSDRIYQHPCQQQTRWLVGAKRDWILAEFGIGGELCLGTRYAAYSSITSLFQPTPFTIQDSQPFPCCILQVYSDFELADGAAPDLPHQLKCNIQLHRH